jgi:hypothetical protein
MVKGTSSQAMFMGLLVSTCAVLALAGCSTVTGAVQEGQQALGSAGQAIDAADGLIQAATDLGAACAAAQAAWVPGVSPQDARNAINEAVAIVDGVLAQAPEFPGAREIDQILGSAQEALAQDPSGTSLGVSRSTLETACALVTLGG